MIRGRDGSPQHPSEKGGVRGRPDGELRVVGPPADGGKIDSSEESCRDATIRLAVCQGEGILGQDRIAWLDMPPEQLYEAGAMRTYASLYCVNLGKGRVTLDG